MNGKVWISLFYYGYCASKFLLPDQYPASVPAVFLTMTQDYG